MDFEPLHQLWNSKAYLNFSFNISITGQSDCSRRHLTTEHSTAWGDSELMLLSNEKTDLFATWMWWSIWHLLLMKYYGILTCWYQYQGCHVSLTESFRQTQTETLKIQNFFSMDLGHSSCFLNFLQYQTFILVMPNSAYSNIRVVADFFCVLNKHWFEVHVATALCPFQYPQHCRAFCFGMVTYDSYHSVPIFIMHV